MIKKLISGAHSRVIKRKLIRLIYYLSKYDDRTLKFYRLIAHPKVHFRRRWRETREKYRPE